MFDEYIIEASLHRLDGRVNPRVYELNSESMNMFMNSFCPDMEDEVMDNLDVNKKP